MGLWRCVELPGAAWQRAGFVARAARELFAEHGYRVTTREIADRAGVSHDLIFRYFDSKEGLFFESVGRPLLDAVDGLHRRWLDDPACSHSIRKNSRTASPLTSTASSPTTKQSLARWSTCSLRDRPAPSSTSYGPASMTRSVRCCRRSTPCCPSTGSGALRRPCSSGSCCSSWVRSRHSCPRHISEMTTPRRERR
ncbi:bacterial regulatory s, tetR family protein [Mycobacterium xenopi 4042]|uniref:Bacterial regulatory s, tetR family protein n=1 Tax=Mycobacterium xenopi 4042 TaxID=1299334 RepID=X8DEL7_MYCXE|nr:bacterial regulatory s, tetR family protein [Mycobacterium xenopi 4042]